MVTVQQHTSKREESELLGTTPRSSSYIFQVVLRLRLRLRLLSCEEWSHINNEVQRQVTPCQHRPVACCACNCRAFLAARPPDAPFPARQNEDLGKNANTSLVKLRKPNPHLRYPEPSEAAINRKEQLQNTFQGALRFVDGLDFWLVYHGEWNGCWGCTHTWV